MTAPLRLALGLLICVSTWLLVLRRGAGARLLPGPPPLAAVLDAAPVLAGFAAALAALARPMLAGLAVAGLAGGLSLADRVKRAVLEEPVVFADRAELLEVFRHPRLYLPFAGSAYVLGGAVAALLAAAAGLAWLEPPVWHRSIPAGLAEATIAGLAVFGCFHLTSATPGLLGRVAFLYRRTLAPSRDPALDSARLGPLATLVVHATLAADERPRRRARAHAHASVAAQPPFPTDGGPVVIVQAESFMDPARLHPALAGVLPAFHARAAQRGQFDVPAWGANTVRSEFAVLTGIRQSLLGLDSYNPYEAFVGANLRLHGLPHAARQAGYHTVFVHPFDLRFYGRRRVLPQLGFDELVGPEAFRQATRRGAYVADEAVGAVVQGVLRRHGPRVLVFAATMEAHGPWPEDMTGPRVPLPDSLAHGPDAGQLGRWLWHLQGTDRMLAALQRTVVAERSGWLALYGDHQPSLPGAFANAGLADRRTDYAIWGSAPTARVADLAAHELGAALAAAMAVPAELALPA